MWIEISVDEKHRIFRCYSCRRLAVAPVHYAAEFAIRMIGKCVCRGA